MLEIFFGVRQSAPGWMPRLQLGIRSQQGQRSNRCIFVLESSLGFLNSYRCYLNHSNYVCYAEYQKSDIEMLTKIVCRMLYLLWDRKIYFSQKKQ